MDILFEVVGCRREISEVVGTCRRGSHRVFEEDSDLNCLGAQIGLARHQECFGCRSVCRHYYLF